MRACCSLILEPMIGIKKLVKRFSFTSTLQFIFIAVSLCAFLFSAWVLWLIPLYGDDLWHLPSLRSSSLGDLLSKPVFGDSNHIPLFHLWMWLSSVLSIEFPWIHTIQALLLLSTCGLFHLYLKQMTIPVWIRWMVTALFLTTPTIAESIYWTSATHQWLGCLWILTALILLPRTAEANHFWRWLATFLCLLFAMLTSELTYGFCVLFIGVLGLKYRKTPQVVSGCVMVALLMIALVAQRNHLITGDWTQLALDRDLNRAFFLKKIYLSLYEFLVYAHPLSLVDKFSTGYFVRNKLSEGWLFFHLIWQTFIWVVILQRKGRNGWELFLLAFATPLMIILSKGLIYERYLMATIIANVLAIGIFVDCFRPPFSEKLLKTGGIVMVVVVFINLNTFVQRTLEHWVKDAVRYQNIMALAQHEKPDRTNPIGLVDALSRYYRPVQAREWWAAPPNTLYEYQLILAERELPGCIYDLLEFLPFEGHIYHYFHLWSIAYLKDACPWPPQELRCFKYYETGLAQGEFREFKGQVQLAYLSDENASKPQELPITCR